MLTRQELCGTNVDSTAVDQVLLLAILLQWYSTVYGSSVILWLWCLRRLDVTVGYANVSNGGTLWSICPPTCQVTNVHPISWSAELRSLHACRDFDVVPYCVRRSPPARSDHFCLERITSFVAATADPLLPWSVYV